MFPRARFGRGLSKGQLWKILSRMVIHSKIYLGTLPALLLLVVVVVFTEIVLKANNKFVVPPYFLLDMFRYCLLETSWTLHNYLK